MPNVDVPGLGVVEFPDEMSQSDIEGALRKHTERIAEWGTTQAGALPGQLSTMIQRGALAQPDEQPQPPTPTTPAPASDMMDEMTVSSPIGVPMRVSLPKDPTQGLLTLPSATVPEDLSGDVTLTTPTGVPMRVPRKLAAQAGGALYNVAKSVPEFLTSPAGAATALLPETALGKSAMQGLFAVLAAKGGAEALGEASVTGDTQKALEGALMLGTSPLLAKPTLPQMPRSGLLEGPLATGELLQMPPRAVPQPRPRAPRPEVPATPTEPQRALTVIEEIRAMGAKTKEQIRELFPQLSREQAAQLRDKAWGPPPSTEAIAAVRANLPRGDILEGLPGGQDQPIYPQAEGLLRDILQGQKGAQNAANARIEQQGSQPEYPRVAPRSDVPINQPEVRQAEGAEAGGGNRPEPSAEIQGSEPLQPLTPEQQAEERRRLDEELGQTETPTEPSVTPASLALETQKAAGWDTKWPFVPADFQNKTFRDAIEADPNISAAEKDKMFAAAEKLLGGKIERAAKPPVEPSAEPAPATPPPSPAQAKGETKVPASIHKDPSGKPVEASSPETGRQYFRKDPDSGRWLRVRYDGISGTMDQHQIHEWTWLEGSQKGSKSSQYGQGGFYGAKTQVAEPYVPEHGTVSDRFRTEQELRNVRSQARTAQGNARTRLNEKARLLNERLKQIDAYAVEEESKAKSQPNPPPVAKVEEQVQKVARTEGHRSAKEVKSELVQRVTDALAKAPEKLVYNAADHGVVEINIPGDGDFKVPNNKQALGEMLQKVNRISTATEPPKPARIPIGKSDVREEAKSVIKAYGSPEAAYRSVKRQIEALPENDPESANKAEAARFLQKEIYGETKAGKSEAQAEKAREAEAVYREGAEGFRKEIARIQALKKKKQSHLIDLNQFQLRYAENQKRLAQYTADAERLEQEAAKEKAALESNLPPEFGGPGGEKGPYEGDISMGPGAAPAGGKTKAQIEQLTDAFRGVSGKKVPVSEKLREAFSIGERLSTAKDTLSKAVSGLKASGDYLIGKWKHGLTEASTWDALMRAKGELSAAIEARGWRVKQWVKIARKATPSMRDQAAIAKWVDAGGDPVKLRQGLAEAPDKYKQAYQDALNLSGDLKTAAQNIQNYFESRLQEAIDAGVLKEGVEDYIHRLYESKPKQAQKLIAHVQNGLLARNPDLAKKRVFDFDWEAEKLGYKPVQSYITRIAAYEQSLSKAIAAREFIKKATTMAAADGRPIIDVKGVGIPVNDPITGEREATLIKPQFNPAKSNVAGTPNYRGDYVNKEFPALSKWKWVASDSAGKPILVQGDVAIHPDYVSRISALLEPSRVRYGRYGHVLGPALNFGSAVKQTMLDLSLFHPVQVTVHGMEHRIMPWSIVKDIDLNDPKTQGLLRGGVTLGGDYHGMAGEGLAGGSLTRHIPMLGPVLDTYHQWLFQDYIPRLKMTMAHHALDRNMKRYAGIKTPEQIYSLTASEANAAFGEQNYIMLERSKTAQDMARLILLAPDFLEARGRFAGQALTKGGKAFGNEQRTALLLGALTMYATARLLNKAISGQSHNEPDNLFSVVIDGKSYGLRTVQGDILHMLERPLQFWMHRLNPVYGRTFLEAMTQRDEFGRKRTAPQMAWDAVSTAVPISLRSSRERSLWESMANSFGVTARRFNDVDTTYKLAQKWKEQNGVPERGEFIYDPDKDPLRGLKIALSNHDQGGAVKELDKVLASKSYTPQKLDDYFKRYAALPFAGSKANDAKFAKTLTEDEKKTLDAAREHKKAMLRLYQQAKAIRGARQGQVGQR